MEDYSVGSLSELISGKSAGKKQKLIKKDFSPQKGKKHQLKEKQGGPPAKMGKLSPAKQNGNANKQNSNAKNKGKNANAKKSPIKKVEKEVENEEESDDINEADSDEGEDSDEEQNLEAENDESDAEEEAEGSNDENDSSGESDADDKSENDDEITNALGSDLAAGSDESESEDESPAGKKTNVEKVKEDPELLKDRQQRTIFVGNVPLKTSKQALEKLFKKYGNVESLWLRSVPTSNPKIPQKVAVIKKDFNEKRASLNCYVRYTKREEALKALEVNGTIFKDHHLRVNMCDESKSEHDVSKAVFVGNLPFDAEDDDLWKIFEKCGEIESVRIVRDGRTQAGKGFGYVNFKSSDSVELALQMGSVQCKKRELRINRCTKGAPKKQRTPKKKVIKQNKPEGGQTKSPKTNGEFQGKTSDKKNNKKNKRGGDKQKKKMMKQLASIPNKKAQTS